MVIETKTIEMINQSGLAAPQFHQLEDIRICIGLNKAALNTKLFRQLFKTIEIDVIVQDSDFFILQIDN